MDLSPDAEGQDLKDLRFDGEIAVTGSDLADAFIGLRKADNAS